MTRAIETAAPGQPWADLERLALAATDRSEMDAAIATTVPGWRESSTTYNDAVQAYHSRQNAFRAAANPAKVLELIAAARANAVGIDRQVDEPNDAGVVGELVSAAKELDRMTLVILAAVNYADKGNLDAVSDALTAQRAALAKYATQQPDDINWKAEWEAKSSRLISLADAARPFADIAVELDACGDGQPIGIKAASGRSDLNVGSKGHRRMEPPLSQPKQFQKKRT